MEVYQKKKKERQHGVPARKVKRGITYGLNHYENTPIQIYLKFYHKKKITIFR